MTTPLTEPTILVSGATDGIGKGTARELGRRGAHVLLHCRDADRTAAVRDEIAAATGKHRLETYVADFASLREVHRLAEQVAAPGTTVFTSSSTPPALAPVHVADSVRSAPMARLQVNHLAPLLLAHLLLPLLRAGAPARIVNVASAGQAPLDFADLTFERGYDGMRTYFRSKLDGDGHHRACRPQFSPPIIPPKGFSAQPIGPRLDDHLQRVEHVGHRCRPWLQEDG